MMSPRIVNTAAALVIGNELLSGKVREANVHALATALRGLGIKLCRTHLVGDELDTIAEEVRVLSRQHDVLFTSGGIGPTHDDVTIAGVAAAFGLTVARHPDLTSMLERTYGASLRDEHLEMARAPEGAELFETPDVRWPTIVVQNVWILPGVPEIFRMKLGVVRAHLRGPTPFFSRALYSLLEEAELKPLLDRVVAEHPEVELGSYPKWFDATYRTKITFDGREANAVEHAFEALVRLLPPGEPQRVE
jgi:molybdenum cofactor synthesis domain-containing protein